MASDPSATSRSAVPSSPAAIPGPGTGVTASPPPLAASGAAVVAATAPSLVGKGVAGAGPSASLWRDAWRRLQRNRAALAGLAFIVLVAASAILADVLAPYPFWQQDLSIVRQPPTPEHLLGTD